MSTFIDCHFQAAKSSSVALSHLLSLSHKHRDHNPYGGCHPGVDCPWYPSKTGEPHCESSANFAGIHGLRESAELCCRQHFSQLNRATCVIDSEADVAAEKAKVAQDLAREKYYYPDLHGKQNCVFSNHYEDWMMGAVSCLYS